VYVNRRLFDAQSKSYVVDHSALVLLVDPQQRIRAAIPSTGRPAVIAASIVRAV
jgi:cytochrome oxidase Cu insertion factor (SCO1/SenC/PrrC family)